jgi:hypothetical protein
VMSRLEIEHLIPRALGGLDDESNLWLSCGLCNRYKGSQTVGVDPTEGTQVPLFNPRTQIWQLKCAAIGCWRGGILLKSEVRGGCVFALSFGFFHGCDNTSISAFASCKSFVSNPSVNQP